ncbi:PAS domain-containing protein [Aurantibacter crassamenti]|uniref:ATP-binding protein n=1 Tax=Aurantibacter crassamenti TaxID=1837375 RepID=UPI00193A7787|nr:ATP-binding protein [Aurantibacter crassamenti]MBM1104576.1 PAS domain-containing protein [Aurantibacter crassamenti]
MKLSKIPSSYKLYVIILIIAVGILLFTAAIVYKQTTGLQKSSELVSHSLEVQKEINNLFASYTLLVATQFDVLLKDDSKLRDNVFTYQNEGNESMARLKELTKDNIIQQNHLKEMDGLNAQLYNRVVSSTLDTTSKKDSVLKANVQYIITIDLLEDILQLKEDMMLEEESKLEQRKEDYSSRISLTPVASIASFLFSLLIFLFAFQKINSSRKRITNTQMFLEKILKSTNNVVVYYEPIHNQNGKIIDFNIAYSNDVIVDATGDTADEIIGRKMSDVYPVMLENGVSDIMIKSYETNSIQQIEKEYTEFFGTPQVFSSTASKLDEGVLLISAEKTAEVMAERKLKSLNKNLTIQNTILTDAERLAKIGSFQWDLISLESTISDNYYRILGYEPGELELNPENHRKLIHPDDVKLYDLNFKKAVENNTIEDTTYRVLTKNKKIKYLNTSGHIENNTVIGLVRDVTSELKAEQKLRDKNRDLKRSNEELESFNRVASHDLQEPLRKIQMFISRLSSAELDNLSVKGRGYIEKVNSSANRMQTLVKYLLSYSRINKTKDDFVKINLDDVLDKVKEDLEDRIKETGVHIAIDNMPTLKAVPFQMEQLFNNLLSNAIKYRNADVESKIIIDCKKVTSKQIGDDFVTKSKKYYRISIMDNGIGFNQENAKKIFELFQRLHQKHEYSGTGIGLAICKKIVENHNGHIVAESAPGEGSTFCIYLPA